MALKLYHRTRKRRASPEAELQKAVVQYLRLAGVPNLMFFSVPNEAKRSPRLANHLKAMGMTSGVSDLVICVPDSGVMFLELKAKGEKPTAAQTQFAYAATLAGHAWACVDNINAAIDLLGIIGAIKAIPRRRAASPLSEAA